MWRAVPLLLALQAALVFADPLDGALPGAAGDDECLAGGEGGCALNALQRRGARLSSEKPEAGAAVTAEGAAEGAAESGKDLGPDISRKDMAQMIKRIKKHKRKLIKIQKSMNTVEKSINETYVMTMKELNPGKDVVPPPMKTGHRRGRAEEDVRASSGRRRRHHSIPLPRRMRKVDAYIRACTDVTKSIWKRVKRCSDILVFTRKRIMGGEIRANATLASSAEEGGAAPGASGEPEEAPTEDVPAEGGSDGGEEVRMMMGREDLEARIKQMNTENYDLKRDIKELETRDEKTRKLFKDTFRVM